jgi:hypothetical protein
MPEEMRYDTQYKKFTDEISAADVMHKITEFLIAAWDRDPE